MKYIAFTFFLIQSALALDPCVIAKLKICDNKGLGGKSIGASNPTSSSSFSSPSALASAKGLGLEGILWDGLDISLITGNGQIGAGISSSNSDDTFFGNTAKELESDYETRVASGLVTGNGKYDLKKYTFATALTLYKTKKKLFTVNLGLLAKYIEETSNIHFGVGASFSLGPLNVGITRFKDEGIAQDLDSLGTRDATSFYVNTINAGVNLHFLNLDYTFFDNQLGHNNQAHIFSGGIFIKKFIFSYGRRLEISSRRKYDFTNNIFLEQERVWRSFTGLQYQISKKWMMGALVNYYLNQELSLVLTGFF